VANWQGKNWITKGTNGRNKNVDRELKESGWFLVQLIWEEAKSERTNGSV
jgi:hypothetical protein